MIAGLGGKHRAWQAHSEAEVELAPEDTARLVDRLRIIHREAETGVAGQIQLLAVVPVEQVVHADAEFDLWVPPRLLPSAAGRSLSPVKTAFINADGRRPR